MTEEFNEKSLRILIVHNHYQLAGGEDTVVKNETEMLQKLIHLQMLILNQNQLINQLHKQMLKTLIQFQQMLILNHKQLIKHLHKQMLKTLIQFQLILNHKQKVINKQNQKH